MKMSRVAMGCAVILAGLAVGTVVIGQSVPAELTLATEPLFLKNRVKPAFIMAVDDSGSMNWETLFATQDGEATWGRDTSNGTDWGFYRNNGNLRKSGEGSDNTADWKELFPFPGRAQSENSIPPTSNFGFARSFEFNPGYFNPGEKYLPWKKSDGSSWESLDTTAEWQSVKVDPRNGVLTGTWNASTFDLTSNVRKNPNSGDNNDWDFDFRRGMVVPSGTEINDNCNNFPSGVSGWVTTTADLTLTGDCNMSVSYFPATYYLTTSTSPDGNTGGTQITSAPGGKANLYRFEIKSANYADTAAYNAAMTNFANWFTYYRSRNLALVGAMTQSFDKVEYMRAGYFEINDRNAVTMYDMSTDNGNRAGLYNKMTALNASGSTPNRRAVEFLGSQFSRTDADAPVQKACQVNAGMLFTDGYTNDDAGTRSNVDQGMGSPYADIQSGTIADTAAYYYNNNLRSGTTGTPIWENRVEVPVPCDANSPLQDCRNDPHMNFYGITLGALGEIYGTGSYIDNPATTADEALAAVMATPPTWTATGSTNNQLSNVDDIWHATINARGKFINARSPAAVTAAMRNILTAVADKEKPSGSQSVAGARLNGGSFNVTPSFGRRNNGKDWFGTLTAYRINPTDGSNGAQLWEAAAKLDTLGPTARNIWTATSNVTSTNRTTAVVEFKDAGLAVADVGMTDAKLTAFGVVESDMFDYLRGARTYEGTKLRGRSTRLGDIVNSSPQISTAKDDFGWADASGLTAAVRTAYTTYLTSDGPTGKKDRQSFVFVGANDGMLHAFEGDEPCTVNSKPAMCTPTTAGNEAFAYVPNGVLNKVGSLIDPEYVHKFYVDGPLALGDVYTGTAWKSVLVGTSGAGGRGVFGLDVSNPTGFDQGSVLWEVNATTDGDIGYVMGTPVIAPINNGGTAVRWVAIFGNGYNSSRSEPVLYMVDVMTGAVVHKIVADDTNNTVANGLGNVAAIDTDNDGLVDTVYGGDLQGNLWKFALSGTTWGVAYSGLPLFKATDGTNAQPITGGLEVSAGPGAGVSVFFGTGRYFVDGDNNVGTTPQVQSLYSIWDNGTAITTGRAALQVQTINSETSTSTPSFRSTTTNSVNYTTKRGWYLDLKVGTAAGAAKGERFIGTPRLQNGKVFFTTFEPLSDECDPDGRNWLYSLDALTGAAAMSQVSLSADGNPPVCTGSDCGGLALSTGGPVRDTSVLLPPPLPQPGLSGGCVPGSPGCVTPTTPTYQRCTLVIRASGAPPLYLPRPCGRQSWRQIR